MTLYEKEGQCGGHTLTDDSPGYPVDLGFQVLLSARSLPARLCVAAGTRHALLLASLSTWMVGRGGKDCGPFCE